MSIIFQPANSSFVVGYVSSNPQSGLVYPVQGGAAYPQVEAAYPQGWAAYPQGGQVGYTQEPASTYTEKQPL